MSDLVTRLRGWRNWREVHIVRTHLLLEEAAAEIERLRLTDYERAAVGRAVQDENDFGFVYTADALQALLDRISQNSDCPDLDNAASPDILAADERAAVEDMASYFDARGNLTMQAWGSLLHVLLGRMA